MPCHGFQLIFLFKMSVLNFQYTAIMFKKKSIQWPWLILLLCTPFVLWLLPSDFFDGGGGVVLCPSRLLFGLECLGCGMTRAIQHMHHFELADAMYYHSAVVVAYPALALVWFVWVKNAIQEIKSINEGEETQN